MCRSLTFSFISNTASVSWYIFLDITYFVDKWKVGRYWINQIQQDTK